MSNKRPLSPEPINISTNDNNTRSLKRLKLHSIIEELRNEEANLVLLKKLRACQQLATRTNNTPSTTNGFHPTATRVPTNKPSIPVTPISTTNSSQSRSSLPQPLPSATRKPTNIVNPPIPIKIPTPLPSKPSSTIQSLEDRKTQAKKALRNQLERDLLNIPSPKPLIQDVLFIPNPTSLEFQPYVGLEDVVQCLSELQTDRQRLPQRFTDRAQIDEPNICEHCGTDFTIRWWKHLNNNQQINILCDRCKKQVIRRTSKSEHSALLKNVFVSAMEQEKEIEKTFQTLIKQHQKTTSRSITPSTTPAVSKPITNNRPVPPVITSNHIQNNNNHNHNHHHNNNNNNNNNNHHHQQKPKTKSSLPQAQNFATKLSQQSTLPINAARKSNVTIPQQLNLTNNNIRSLSQTKTPMPAHQQYRSASALPQQQQQQQQQQQKMNQMIKMPKSAVRQQPVVPSRPLYPPTGGIIPSSTIHPSLSTSANVRPTATKRRTLHSDNLSGSKKALVFVANGSEDIEVVATVDILRRGGIDVKLCSVEKNDTKSLTCANNIQIMPDLHVDDVQGQEFDAVIVPGGSKGTEKIAACKKAGAILLDHYKSKKIVAAICAGPTALSTHLYNADKNVRQHDITCYPDVANSLRKQFKSIQLDQTVVDSEVNNHRLITSQGPATAIEFGLKILSCLTDKKKAEEIRQKVLA
ncbi:hypothetical protein I4U23_000932 [Adineta vaga]|nr:hypothetical protein I4U23_000932 [Adineta vaga]